ncbi:LOW QUALITY PROTEIN: Chromodomain protein [Phytophthora megakarya]|uniref:Chromodomain protein n=1 Tax=Phytophthora megakarya TaxID=4795 RepID=A0A225VEA8_9STRA|nr:LOW QUALITY PROTEIN: Chromodomain protein [Phytophthora megakarya]
MAYSRKEAYAILETRRRSYYLLHRPDGFALFTDHRDLCYIFDPHGISNSVPKYTADKLDRWSLLLMRYQYAIHDIAGDETVWADLLSRWGSSFKTICAIWQVPVPLSPQLDGDFVWPTQQEIASVQHTAATPSTMTQTEEDSRQSGRIWIPDNAIDLQVRVCVVGHFGIAGHRGTAVTLQKIGEHFVWTDMKIDIDYFVKRCLNCATTVGGPPVPRAVGEAMHADKPNDLLHWDFFSFMGEIDTQREYVLVIKDDASKYVWLLVCTSADAETTFESLFDWFAAFGVCRAWVFDQGTHFKNKTIEALQHALGVHHHFTTAQCPWANGTVEMVNREVLRCCRALLSEWRMQPREWPRVIKIVQMVLNHTPSPVVGGVAPITAMTGLKNGS